MRTLLLLFIVVSGMFSAVPLADASVISLESDFGSLHVGDKVTVQVRVDTELQTINAIESTVTFPSDLLAYEASDDSDSVVSLWVEKPQLVGVSDLHFSGVTPGGFIEANAQVLTLMFTVIATGQAFLTIGDTALLLHDGSGTAASVAKQSLHISVINGPSAITMQTVDTEIPEHFVPTVLIDLDVFDGRPALIFATNDKGSGIDTYEVREGWWGRSITAQSPYEIIHQSLDTVFYVKAIDRAGNVRAETFYPHNWRPWYKAPEILGTILVLCVLMLGLVGMWYRRQYRS